MPTVRFYNQCSGETVDHVLWDFNDGTASTSMASTVDHYYGTGGDYTVSLQAWSVSGKTQTKTKVVSIEVPVPSTPTPSLGEVLYIAAGTEGKIYKSDGTSWATQQISGINFFYGVFYLNDIWFLLGTKTDKQPAIYKSSNGTDWNDISPTVSPTPDIYAIFSSITFFNSYYTAVGYIINSGMAYSSIMFRSSDLVAWTQIDPDIDTNILTTIEGSFTAAIASGIVFTV